MTEKIITTLSLPSLPKLASGKVRELFQVDTSTLLFCATDRISAYDVILANGVPLKGAVLTQLSAHWFRYLSAALPDLETHFLTLSPPAALTRDEKRLVRGRSMQTRRLKVFPLEAIVRGYLVGSAWAEYLAKGTVHGIAVVPGLERCARLPAPLYTPSRKAEQGAHDENISPDEAAAIVGDEYARRIAKLAVEIYTAAAEYALERGIIIVDTKFEFGLDESTDTIVLIDEVLTPDSSRFWTAADYQPGREQVSLDKQYLRDWLTAQGLQGKEGVVMPEQILRATSERYLDVFYKLTGRTLDEALREVEGDEEDEEKEAR